MINHAYTLLLNEPPSLAIHKEHNKNIGNLPVDPTFRPVALPAELQLLYQALLPYSDRFAKNYIISCYLDILHAVDFNDYTLSMDPRITYIPGDARYKQVFDAGIKFNTITKHGTGFEYKINKPLQDYKITSICKWHFDAPYGVSVKITGDDTIDMQLPVATNEIKLLDGHISLFLPRSPFKFDMQVKTIKPFVLKGYDDNIRNLISNKLTKVQSELFGTEEAQPFKTLWTEHPESMYRIGGLLSALLYKMESIRVN